MYKTDEYELNQDKHSENKDNVDLENKIEKDDSINIKSIVKNGLLAIDAVLILQFISGRNTALKLLTVALIALLFTFCTYVHLLNKSKNKDALRKLDKYISATVLGVALTLKLICYISYLIIVIFNTPVNSEDYGFSILLSLPVVFALYIDMFAYPFLYIYSGHRLTKVFIKATAVFIILVFIILGTLLAIGSLKA